MDVLRRIIRATDLHSRFLMTNYGLTTPQLTVLSDLSGHNDMSVSDLSKAMHLSQATVTGIVDRLQSRGLVLRRRSSRDKRRTLVYLTDQGREILSKAPPFIHEDFNHRFNELPRWQQTMILASLQRLVSLMETADVPRPKETAASDTIPDQRQYGQSESVAPTVNDGQGGLTS